MDSLSRSGSVAGSGAAEDPGCFAHRGGDRSGSAMAHARNRIVFSIALIWWDRAAD